MSPDDLIEQCALMADLFEEENMRMCSDSIILDPVLAKGRRNSGEAVTVDEWAASERHQLDGTIHSAMGQAARMIAENIRALKGRFP